MSNAPIDGRFAPPQAHVEDINVSWNQLEPASRASRFWAATIDSLIALFMVWLASRLTPWDPFHPKDPGLTAFQPLNALIGIALYLAVHGYLLATRGQSIGKILLKIRIVRTDGSRASFQRLAGLRYALPGLFQSVPAVGMLYSLVDVAMIFRDSRRTLHDQIADTIVVKA